MLKNIQILGLRGFATQQSLKFACPDGEKGSGLTILVGSNNSGKSTIVEALRALSQTKPPSITRGRRNIQAGDRIYIQAETDDGQTLTLQSVESGGSETSFTSDEGRVQLNRLFILPSRRSFNPYFSKSESTRDVYIEHRIGFPAIRTSSVDNFSQRLFNALKNKKQFNEVLSNVLTPVPDWTIDQEDTGQFYLKIKTKDSSHSSEGLGDGLISLFYTTEAMV